MDSSHHLHLTSNFSGMGGADEGSSSGRRSREIENLSLEISKYPRDLLQTFMVRNPQRIVRVKEEEEDEGVELHLGLSLGGKFGVDKSHMGLLRSSSITGPLPLIREDDPVVQPPPLVAPPPLARAASLPFDTEEEWRKRKELQTFRRMEAKKRRSEKQRNMKGCGEGRGGSGGGSEAGLISGEKLEKLQHCTRVFKSACLPNVAGAACSANQSAVDDVEKGKRSFFSSLQGLLAQQGSQGSAESQGCGSSGPSESDSRPTQGSSSEAKSPVARTTNDIGSGMEDTLKQAVTGGDNAKKRETGTNLEDIPCVFTIGDGPNGRKVDGILYKYGKGEDVRIMCVCHGGFFSPAEFVKHAGGCDVEHPLRHIVVDPSCSAFR